MSNPFVKITSDATKEAMQAQARYQIDAHRQKANRLAAEVVDRLECLSIRVDEVKRNVRLAVEHGVGYSRGAFGADTATIDELLVALSEEVERLHDRQAASEAADELSEKYGRIVAEMDVPAAPGAGEGHVFEMPAAAGGAYL